MKETFSKKAQENYMSGYSCSESMIVTAIEFNLIPKDTNTKQLLQMASAFSGGLGGSGCLCGSISGSHIVLGLIFGRDSKDKTSKLVRSLSAKFVEKFKEERKATCCRVLTSKFKDDPIGRKNNCSINVKTSAEILYSLVEQELKVVK